MAERPEDLEEMVSKVHSQRDAATFAASARTKTLEKILEQIDPIAKKGEPYAVVQIPSTVKPDELRLTITILKARGFRVTSETHVTSDGSGTNLKIEWLFDLK